MRALKNPKTLEAVIRAALSRELTKMQQADTGHLHDGWTGHALASWVAPGVIASVKRHLTVTGKPSGHQDRRKPAGL